MLRLRNVFGLLKTKAVILVINVKSESTEK